MKTMHDRKISFLSFKVHVEQELLIYEAFPYDQQQPQNNLKVRFKKVRAEIDRDGLREVEFE